MRQHQERLIVFALAQFGDVVRDLLTHAFDVIEDANFPTNELHDPDGERIGPRPAAAEIEECPVRQNRIRTDMPDATFRLGRGGGWQNRLPRTPWRTRLPKYDRNARGTVSDRAGVLLQEAPRCFGNSGPGRASAPEF